jgi:protein FAM50
MVLAEAIEVTYSYWDGTGHRRTLKCTKGASIAKFLDMVRCEFRELRGLSVDDLIYIKEDLIIPQVRVSMSVCVCLYVLVFVWSTHV